MDNILVDISAVVIAIVLSYAVFWFKKHKTEIDQKRNEGDAIAFALDILGKITTNVVYDLKDSSEKGAAKKKEAKAKIKSFYADAHLPVPSDDVISGGIERAVQTMKLADEGDNNVKNG